MTAADHTRFVPIIRRAITASVVAAAADDTARSTEPFAAWLAEAPNGRSTEDVGARLRPMARSILVRAVFGIDSDLPARADLDHHLDGLGIGARLPRPRPRQIATSLRAIGDLVAGAARAGDLPEDSIAGQLAGEPDQLADPTVVGNLAYLTIAGANDIAALMRWLVETTAAEGLVDEHVASRVVRETLRLEQGEFVLRRVRRPVEIAGYRVPAGWYLRCCSREAHRDPRRWSCPAEFDTGRPDDDYQGAEYAPFGHHPRHCLGAGLTRAVGTAFVAGLVRAGRLERTDARAPRHARFHWEPASTIAVRRHDRVTVVRDGPGPDRGSAPPRHEA